MSLKTLVIYLFLFIFGTNLVQAENLDLLKLDFYGGTRWESQTDGDPFKIDVLRLYAEQTIQDPETAPSFFFNMALSQKLLPLLSMISLLKKSKKPGFP